MEFLKNVYERRKKYFEKIDYYLADIKEIVNKIVPDAEIYLYGSIIEGSYSIGLSDIDLAIVSDSFSDRKMKMEVLGLLLKSYFDSPFEFHVLTKEEWKFRLRFIKVFKSV